MILNFIKEINLHELMLYIIQKKRLYIIYICIYSYNITLREIQYKFKIQINSK